MASTIITFQEFIAKGGVAFIEEAITRHKRSELYQTARDADAYDKQRNVTINNYVQTIFSLTGSKLEDFTASNNKIACNYFHRLNTQRNMYSLGSGISFAGGRDGVDETKEKLGKAFDDLMQDAGYKALIHGVSFVFWNFDRIHVFPVTEFVPIWDEDSGELKAGIRFWQINDDSPLVAVLYEEDGYTKLKKAKGSDKFVVTEEKRAYKQTISYVPADGEGVVIGEDNYGKLPIVPLWGSKIHQSTLVGMRSAIDSYDLIRSGFANDLTDVSEIYWIVENAGGMEDNDLAKLRDRLKLTHMANVDTDDGGKLTPYTQEIPHEARAAYLDMIRKGIYEDFGGLDVHTIAAGATNDHIDAAYQPLDEEAADYERELKRCIDRILELAGIDDEPMFRHLRISNQKEQVETVMLEAQYLDRETILAKLPNISPDEVAEIMDRQDKEDFKRYGDPFANIDGGEE